MGGTLLHDDGGGTRNESLKAVWRVGEIRRGSRKRKEGAASASESIIYTERNDEYRLRLMGRDPERQRYPPGTVDFFAVLIIPVDVWYILPPEIVIATTRNLAFSPKTRRERYAEYWEAWHLLKRLDSRSKPVWTRTGRKQGQKTKPRPKIPRRLHL